jgi:hypothetical protein
VLQTKRGKKARSLTEAEYVAVMKYFVAVVQLVYNLHGNEFPHGSPVWACDHAPWHSKSAHAQIGLTVGQRLPVPPRSPDFQKPIEHCFGVMSKKFQNVLYSTDYNDLHTVGQYKACLKGIFQSLTKEHIRKDVASLKQLYKVVMKSRATGGVEGDWPPSKYT